MNKAIHDVQISSEFKKLIPPLTVDEFDQLERNCLADGIREPLCVAVYPNENGEMCEHLADGHNRLKIAHKHGLTYGTFKKEFENKDAVIIWIIDNQQGRRNLADFSKYVLAQKKAEILKKKGREKMSEYGKIGREIQIGGLSKTDKPPKEEKHNTREELAKDLGWSSTKTARAAVVFKNADEKTKEALIKKDKTIHQAYKEIKQAERKKKAERLKTIGIQTSLPATIKLIEGNLFDVIGQVKDGSIDLLNTDPPYKILEEEWDKFNSVPEYLDFTKKWMKAVFPKVKATGRIYFSIAQWYQYDVYNILSKNDFFGFDFGQTLIWYYKNNNKPSDRKRYRYNYEPILYLIGKDAPELYWTSDTYGEMGQNVWEIAQPQSNYKEGKYHKAQKPLELYKRIIKTGCPVNGIVLDCFAGSGTTGIICNELKKDCILIESNPESINLIKNRLNE